jgi:hypothetical protein
MWRCRMIAELVGPSFLSECILGGGADTRSRYRRMNLFTVIIFAQKKYPIRDWGGIERHRDRSFGPKTSHWEPRKRK